MRSLLLALVVTAALGESLNPITRVVQLMEGLSKKTEADGKAEEDLFDKYVCWYKTVVSTKKGTNAQAKDRIEALTAYMDDVKSGRVEFTSERKDLEAEIEKLSTEIETATAMRNKENEDFEAAKKEMDQAIAALELAVEILGDMSKGKEEGVLASMSAEVHRAVELGKNSLSAEDARYLEQALNGEVPKADWKKLNRKATFKMKYKARSFKIQEILADMLQTFQDNLADAKKTEKTAKANFDKLIGSKNDQLSSAQDALAGGEGEGAARALSLEESQSELDALTTQVENDEKYISQAEASYADKVAEWKERKRLRTEEIASISKAIEILSSDDAKDTMGSSFKSQSLFLQDSDEEGRCSPKRRGSKAIDTLRQSAKNHGDTRLMALAVSISSRMSGARAQSRGHFDKIVKEIEKMISDLQDESDEDLKTKETCESDRMEQTKVAKKSAQTMDDQTALINRKKAKIDDCNNEIAAIENQLKETKLQMDEATVDRNKEKLEYEAAKADDQAAAKLIGAAKEVLEKFYEDNGLALVQKSVSRHMAAQPEVEAGAAPPPPPSTFQEPYGGNKGASNGIMSMLDMVKADVEKDIKTGTANEKKAIADYDSFMSSSEELITNLKADKSSLEGEVGDAETAITDAKTQRSEKKTLLDDTMKFLRGIAPSCDYMAVNFELRKANREAEIDGLMGAKAALLGATGQKPVSFLQEPCPL